MIAAVSALMPGEDAFGSRRVVELPRAVTLVALPAGCRFHRTGGRRHVPRVRVRTGARRVRMHMQAGRRPDRCGHHGVILPLGRAYPLCPWQRRGSCS